MITHRNATLRDISTLQKLSGEIWHLYYPGIISKTQIDYMLGEMYNYATLSKEIRSGYYWVLLEYEKKVVGYMSCSMVDESTCKLHKLYIYPDYQGKGIGRRAMELAIDFARRKEAREISLNVNRKNINSIQKYIAMGFSIDHEEDNYLGNYLLDDYVMSQRV